RRARDRPAPAAPRSAASVARAVRRAGTAPRLGASPPREPPRLLELRHELEMQLPFGRRAAGLEAVVYTDEPRGTVDAQPQSDAVVTREIHRRARVGDDARERLRVVPEQRQMLRARPGEPAPLQTRETVAIDPKRLLVDSAQRRRAAERIALVHAEHRLHCAAHTTRSLPRPAAR